MKLFRFFAVLVLILLFTTPVAYSQQTIKGILLDSLSKTPIKYASIGVKNSFAGTISNADGSFVIIIPQSLVGDTLSFSSVGYENKNIPVQYLARQNEAKIYLNEKDNILKAVVVSPKKGEPKLFEYGNKDFNAAIVQADSAYTGHATALLILPDNINKKLHLPAYLEKVKLKIFRNNLQSFKFRLRLQAVELSTGKPGNDLVNENVIVESTIEKGWLEFDVSQLNYEISKPFFLSFEQLFDSYDRAYVSSSYKQYIKTYPERLRVDTSIFEGRKIRTTTIVKGGLELPGTFVAFQKQKTGAEKFTAYQRSSSFGDWEKINNIITATIIVSN